MPLPAFLAAAARLAVLVAAAVTAANAASFARYRRRHLRRIPNPIDESADPLADFRALPSNSAASEEAAGPAPLFPLSNPMSALYLFLLLGSNGPGYNILKRRIGGVVSFSFQATQLTNLYSMYGNLLRNWLAFVI